MLIRIILFTLLFTGLSVLAGAALLRCTSRRTGILSSYAWGLVVLLAAVQLTAYPLYRLNMSFTLFAVLFSVVLLAILLLSLHVLRGSGWIAGCGKERRNRITDMKKSPLLTLIAAGAVLFLAVYMFAFYYPTSDDGYYIPRSMEIIRQNSMGVNVRFAWLGWSEGELPDYTDASTLVFLVSYFSAVTGLNAAVLSKTGLAFCFFLAHIAAILAGAEAIFGENGRFDKKAAALILVIAFQILSVKNSSAGIWMTGYLWNGKAMLPGFLFPMLLAECFGLMRSLEKGTLKGRSWLPVTLLLLAGVSLSVVGLNLPVILYFTFGASYLIFTGFRRLGQIWKGALCSVLPVAFFAVLSYLFVVTGQNDYYESGTASAVGWLDQFLEACDFFQLVLWALSAVWILIRGDRLQKILLVGAPALLLLTFLNPLLVGPVCRYVTTSLVYWRLWWLLPAYLLPAVVLTDLLDRLCGGKLQGGFLCAVLSLVLVSGFEIFRYCITDPAYSVIPYAENLGRLINVRPELRYNLYGINGATYDIARAVEADWDGEERPRMLMYFNRSFEIRQYSPEIVMAVGIRNVQLTDALVPGTGLTEAEFMNTYSGISDGALLSRALRHYGVDYVCFDGGPAAADIEQYGFSHVCDSGGISLWRFTVSPEPED